MSVTGVDFVCVPTQDFDAAVEFYEGVLGLERRTQWGQRKGMEYQAGNLTITVMQMDDFGMQFRPNGAPIALQVDDVHAMRADLEGKGVRFHGDVIDSGVCHMAPFADLDGNPLMLHHRYAPKS